MGAARNGGLRRGGTMGKYLDLAKQVPARKFDSLPELIPTRTSREIYVSPFKEELHESLNRLIGQGVGYIQITSKAEEVYVALTDSVLHDLSQRPGLTVYHAAHLIELSHDEIRLMHSLRTIGGPGGSIEV